MIIFIVIRKIGIKNKEIRIMNEKITFKMNEIKTIDALLYQYGEDEFKSPYSSTIPLIDYSFIMKLNLKK